MKAAGILILAVLVSLFFAPSALAGAVELIEDDIGDLRYVSTSHDSDGNPTVSYEKGGETYKVSLLSHSSRINTRMLVLNKYWETVEEVDGSFIAHYPASYYQHIYYYCRGNYIFKFDTPGFDSDLFEAYLMLYPSDILEPRADSPAAGDPTRELNFREEQEYYTAGYILPQLFDYNHFVAIMERPDLIENGVLDIEGLMEETGLEISQSHEFRTRDGNDYFRDESGDRVILIWFSGDLVFYANFGTGGGADIVDAYFEENPSELDKGDYHFGEGAPETQPGPQAAGTGSNILRLNLRVDTPEEEFYFWAHIYDGPDSTMSADLPLNGSDYGHQPYPARVILTVPRQDGHVYYDEYYGEIGLVPEEMGEINVLFNKKVDIDVSGFPETAVGEAIHVLEIRSRESTCMDTAYSGGVFDDMIGKSDDGLGTYLPAFPESYHIVLHRGEDYPRIYRDVELAHGDTVKADANDVYVNGRRLEPVSYNMGSYRGSEDLYSKLLNTVCYRLGSGERIETGPAEIPANLTANLTSVDLKFTALDKHTETDIPWALVMHNEEMLGITDRNGMFSQTIEAEGGEAPRITLLKMGYKPLNVEVRDGWQTVYMEQTHGLFEVPEGYERYVNTDEIYGWVKSGSSVNEEYVDIHPQEAKLRRYSFPISSGERVEALKAVMAKVRDKENPLMVYDDECMDDKTKYTAECEAWHPSDYTILESGSGVCSDYATLAVSFANSYNIPTRRISVAWVKDTWKTYFTFIPGVEPDMAYHAFSEVYLPGDGWTQFDIGWNALDDPCRYARSSECFVYALAEKDTENEVDRIGVYKCGAYCLDESIEIVLEYCGDTPILECLATLLTADMAPGSGNLVEVDIELSEDSAAFTYMEKLDPGISGAVLDAYRNGEIDEEKAASYMWERAKKGFPGAAEPLDMGLAVDTANSMMGIEFRVERPEKNFMYTFTSWENVYDVTLTVPKSSRAVLPFPGSREAGAESVTYTFSFTEPGEHALHAIFEHSSAVVSGHPVSGALAEVLADRTGSVHYRLDNNQASVLSAIRSGGFEYVYIVDDYGYVPYSLDESLEGYGLKVVRFDGLVRSSAETAAGFWQSSGEVSIADVYDYESVEEARDYALEKGIPLLFTEPEGTPGIVQEAIRLLGASRLTVKDPNQKLSGGPVLPVVGGDWTWAVVFAALIVIGGLGYIFIIRPGKLPGI